MKKRILLFTSSIVLLSALTMSYQQGPAHANQNYTGGPGSIGSCGMSGCHGASTNTTFVVELRRLSTGISGPLVNKYFPDTAYIVTLRGQNNVDANLTRFGFQLMALDSSQTTVNAGTFSNFPTNVDDATVTSSGNRNIVEHYLGSLPKTGNDYVVSFNWTAPSAGMGTVGFYGILNAVNGDNSNSSADKSSAGLATYFREANPTSVAELNADIKINTYPNPVTDKLNISLENAENGTYSISVFDMQGKVVATETATVNKSYKTSINAASWAAGMYHVQLKKDDAQRTIAVVKQ